MSHHFIFYLLTAFFIAALYLAISGFAWSRRVVPGASALALLMLGAAGYAVPYLLQLVSPNLSTALFWYNVSLPGASVLGPAWLVFAEQYTLGRHNLPRRRLALLAIIPLLTCLVAWTNRYHGLYGADFSFDPTAPWPALHWRFGLFYWINFAYAYLTTGLGMVLLLRATLRRGSVFSTQTLFLLSGALVPTVVNVLFVSGFSPVPGMDFAPFGFLITGLCWGVAVTRYHFLDLVPVARERVLETMPAGVLVLDLQDRVVDINPSGARLAGLPAAEIIGRELPPRLAALLVGADGAPARLFELPPQGRASEAWLGEGEGALCLMLHQTPITGRHGRSGTLLLLQDITLRKRALLAEQEQRALAESLRDMAADINQSLRLEEVIDRVLVNLERVVPFDAAYLVLLEMGAGQAPRFRARSGAIAIQPFPTSPAPASCVQEMVQQINDHPRPFLMDPRVMNHACDCYDRAWVRASVGMPIRAHGRLLGVAIIDSAQAWAFNDDHLDRLDTFANQVALAVENARLYAELEQLAIHDERTGLFNRRGLYELAGRELVRAQRYQHPCGLILFDVDHFKHINDTFGHTAGDLVMQVVARACQSAVRQVDVVARYGGDEFIVLLPETGRDAALVAAERIRACVESAEIRLSGSPMRVTISTGIAAAIPGIDIPAAGAPGHAAFDYLLQQADQALYQAKESGRNCVRG